MKCPACPTVDLVLTERSGVQIDYCPHCRGVWLDRGELEKLIERSASYDDDVPRRHDRRDYDDDDDDYRQHRYAKRKSWWRELFD